MAVPESQPRTDWLPPISWNGGTSSFGTAPITRNVPRGPRPPMQARIASALVAVARMTFAPPSVSSSCAGFCELNGTAVERERNRLLIGFALVFTGVAIGRVGLAMAAGGEDSLRGPLNH